MLYEWIQDRHLMWKSPNLTVPRRAYGTIYGLPEVPDVDKIPEAGKGLLRDKCKLKEVLASGYTWGPPADALKSHCKAKYKLGSVLNKRARAFLGAAETWFFAQQDRSFIGTPLEQWPLPNDLLRRLAKIERN